MFDPKQAVPQETGQRLAKGLEVILASLAGKATATFRDARSPEALLALPGPVAALAFRLSRGASGQVTLVLPGAAALGMVKLLLGEDSPAGPTAPGAEEEDALRELANQIAGALATAVGEVRGSSVGFEGPTAQWLSEGGRGLTCEPGSVALVVAVSAGSLAAEVFLAVPRGALVSGPSTALGTGAAAPRGADLPPLTETPTRKDGNGIDLLLDISLPLTVELGRTRMMIRDILHLAPGSVLELDKLAGEPVEILINEKSIARGEVVVIDENFGVRLTSIVTPSERVTNLR